jgi:hypothetical protein
MPSSAVTDMSSLTGFDTGCGIFSTDIPSLTGLIIRKLQNFVIGRRNDEAIQLLSVISGLLHYVRNDEIGLSRHPRIDKIYHFIFYLYPLLR